MRQALCRSDAGRVLSQVARRVVVGRIYRENVIVEHQLPVASGCGRISPLKLLALTCADNKGNMTLHKDVNDSCCLVRFTSQDASIGHAQLA